MKRKLSISIEEGTIEQLEGLVRAGTFRNKSHLVEFAINKFMRDDDNGTE